MVERQEDAMLAELELLRTRLHQSIDEKIDQFFLTVIFKGQEDAALSKGVLFPLAKDTAAFKGMKPMAVILPDRRAVNVTSWREAVTVILCDCMEDPQRRESLMALREIVSGNSRVLISASPDRMKIPLEIDKLLYIEGKFDTEALLQNIRDKLLRPVGYNYRRVVLQCSLPKQELKQSGIERATLPLDRDEEKLDFTMAPL